MRISIVGDKPQDDGYPTKTGATNGSRGRGRGRGAYRGQSRGQQRLNITAEDLEKDLDLWRMETE